ncbi:DegT/DnrJ/EryC1/StrS family aminotransferase [Phaeocystidibacter marisrubri]|uniref:DegT/DnrJ/EryC1/StrS family aminotransferase n=1 Tax=Phaeocystidibacter marisrubri TaxID=1577780 RepID=A0A6L3ZKC1_9FLAO|nr:DegT/DnrJ/EryC1/StrS family aminotransferase [Phaeocystidibacter marisrubri]KAB2817600.1 DegT/DnrJ/EryC1/StrS family aminotransferase [Phaeocystidibacter marisrubri]GGH74552.1 spore coat protein [Phaeocystidibacter marisrubri]
MNIRLFKPSVGQEELDNIKAAFERSWIGLGPNVNEFEEEWAKFVGSEIAIGVNSATAALHLAIACFNFPKGKKVLVPSQTFAATATAVLYNDLVPVFVDSDPVTLGIDLDDMKAKYDEDCVAVIPVHYAGHPVPMEVLVPWAKEKGLRVIEDCAHTAGAMYKGKILGTWGDIGCYSFEEKKLMTTGDGGMMVTNDPELFKDVKAMRWVGIDKDNWKTAQSYTDEKRDAMHWFYEINVLGYKYNMNDLAAAIGLAQLKKLPAMNARRSEIIQKYMDGLQGVEGVMPLLPFEPSNYCYQMFGIRADRRDELMIHLKSKGIATGCHYTPLSMQPLFTPYAKDCGFIEAESERLMTLPLHADLTDEEVEYVIENIRAFK